MEKNPEHANALKWMKRASAQLQNLNREIDKRDRQTQRLEKESAWLLGEVELQQSCLCAVNSRLAVSTMALTEGTDIFKHLGEIRTSLISSASNYFASMKRSEEAYSDLHAVFLRARTSIANLQTQVATYRMDQQRRSNATKDRMMEQHESV
jgi:hypothetical protein